MDKNFKKYLKYKKKYIELKNKQKGGEVILPEKIDMDMYVGIKNLAYTDKSLGYGSVFFVFEKLTPSNYYFWLDYCNDQDNYSYRDRGFVYVNGKGISVSEGITAFKNTLDIFKRGLQTKYNYSIWMVYATKKDPRIIKSSIKYNSNDLYRNTSEYDTFTQEQKEEYDNIMIRQEDIEMTCSVIANNIYPISTHLGILRNYKYLNKRIHPMMNSHSGLSMEIHGFAGLVSKIVYPQIEYMITIPSKIMTSIMKKLLPNIIIGNMSERDNIKKIIKKGPLKDVANEIINFYKDKKEFFNKGILISETNSLLESKSKIEKDFLEYIIKKFDELRIRFKRFLVYPFLEFYELLLTKDSGFFDIEYKDDDIIGKEMDKELKQKIILIYANIELTEENKKNNILSIIDKHLKEYLYNELSSKTIPYDKILQDFEIETRELLVPNNLDFITPIDDNNYRIWYIIKDGIKQQFNRPEWFGTINDREKINQDGHSELYPNGRLLTIMVNIDDLISFWLSTNI